MHMNKLRATLAILITSLFSHAQIANGSIAPDFNLKDINGEWHHLHQYLADYIVE